MCRGKTREEAEQEPSPLFPNYGVGDGVVKVDGEVYSNNCNCSGYSRPAVLELAGQDARIEVLHRGEHVAPSVKSAIAAGKCQLVIQNTCSCSICTHIHLLVNVKYHG